MVGRSGAENPTPRVTACEGCGARLVAGRRGPLPRRCEACRGFDELTYRIATARTMAIRQERPDVAAALERAAQLAGQPPATRFGE